jgi:hypothetical protein
MKYAIRYAALAMAMLSATGFLGGVLHLLRSYDYTHHHFASASVDPSETLFVGVACAAFARIYQLMAESKSDPISKTQTEVELSYVGFIVSWFCFLFVVHKMNLPLRNVSARVFVAFCIFAASAIVVGFMMRSRFFKLSAEALPHDPRKAGHFWRGANFISFCCAINPAIYGVVLKILGSSWYVAGVFFGLSLVFLALWRPRELPCVMVAYLISG